MNIIGPVCAGSTSLDVSNMKDGDFSGLGLLQKNYGLVSVRIDGDKKAIVMINTGTGKPVEAQTIPLNQKLIFFKAECDFTNKNDVANFFLQFRWKNLEGYRLTIKNELYASSFYGLPFRIV